MSLDPGISTPTSAMSKKYSTKIPYFMKSGLLSPENIEPLKLMKPYIPFDSWTIHLLHRKHLNAKSLRFL